MKRLVIKEKFAKSIITPSKLPDSDFVINPYIGCSHGCLYCYACFMKKFTNHNNERWGEFVDIKSNGPLLIPTNTKKYKNKSITIGSVTDPYQPVEKKYRLTENILRKLIPLEPKLFVITKSALVTRDIDLLRQFDHCTVCISITILDDSITKQLEPSASTVTERIETIKLLHAAKIKTVLFMSPIFPYLTEWEKIINITKAYVSEYWFENLNLYHDIEANVFNFLQSINANLVSQYKDIYFQKNSYWSNVKAEIRDFCLRNDINHKIYWHKETK